MDMRPVKSSNIREIGYDPETSTAHINFGQATYAVKGISQEEFDAFAAAPSLGKHYNANIKGKFEISKVGAPPPDKAT